jgi:hypothetical protein
MSCYEKLKSKPLQGTQTWIVTGDVLHGPADISKAAKFLVSRVVNDLSQFKSEADVIVASRIADDIKEVAEKASNRDLFEQD